MLQMGVPMGLETCRMCFSRIPQNAFSLLDISTARMLESLTSINIKPILEVSTVICTKCYLNLKLAYRIQQNIIKSEEKLKTKLHSELVTATVINVKLENDSGGETAATENLIAGDVCVICGDVPQDNDHYQAHFKKAQYCPICSSLFETFQSYKQHLSLCQNEPSYKCAKCQATFRYRSLYDLHVEKLHTEGSENNPLDGAKRRDPICQVDLPISVVQPAAIDDNSNLTCDKCGKRFKTKNSLQHHTHRTKTCPICGKEVHLYRLSLHLKEHEGVQVCEICGARTKNVNSFRSHMFYSHNKARYKCEHCGKVYKKKLMLNVHLQRHKGQASFTCETCGKSFYMNEFLQRHIKMTHLKLRPYICQYCQKGFSSRYAMRTHERQHTNETPYRCDICGEAFRQNVSLKSHKKTKHGVTELLVVKCKVCGKGFASEHALISHARLH